MRLLTVCPPGASVEACLAAVKTVAVRGGGISREEEQLAVALRRYGRAAIPGLLQLLRDPTPGVRSLAAYTLRDFEGLTEAEVSPLLQALRQGEQWVAPALARLGTQEAVQGLFDALRANPEPHTQITWAFKVLGRKGVPDPPAGFGVPE